ncbi:AcrR family transcriptional regulator [Duganella sp. 1224]|uniref:TetR/AcrR family transcriptional regulator n=1 Tax=Duganella sp. 1224 TaxID=2587052 RepID=UPI0015C89F87|nr:TetR/AcrR family transcriptional regulator [Duganella sp. 1224]NYE61574.1 AcrR family transcriptional regulator [Duganella sp. 1224]
MGRHREFDVDQALEAALRVFWRKGYEGTSYTDLTEATGVARPALYSAFGNKEDLFRQVLTRYYAEYLAFFPAAMAQPSARKVVEKILADAAELHTRYQDRRGCLGIHGALAGSDEVTAIQAALIDARNAGEQTLRQRLELARRQGDLPADADPAILAGFVLMVLHGMAVQAKAGVERATLDAIAAQALAGWPSPVDNDL